MLDIGMKNVYCQTQEPRDICAVKVTEMSEPSNSPLSKDLKIPHIKTPPPSNHLSFVWKEETEPVLPTPGGSTSFSGLCQLLTGNWKTIIF